MKDDVRPAFWLSARRLLVVGVVFYASYALANAAAAWRAPVPEVVFAWERQIPFWPWTIFPYWTLNICYALGFFLCESDSVQRRYMQQLLAVQALSVACFLLFPLQMSWSKPAVDGLAGQLFASLAQFDAPYNQAPSLHVSLALIVGRFYWYRLPRHWRLPWALWMGVVGLSVLSTWQHHFIDVPTGLLAGCVVLWALPWQERAVAPSPLVKRYPAIAGWSTGYLLAALLWVALATLGGGWLWALWPAAAYALLALMYARFGASAWQKWQGRHSLAVRLWMLPVRLQVWLNMRAWLRGKPKAAAVTAQVHVGSILAARHYDNVVDVCAEYPLQLPPRYRFVPMLDMTPPSPADLRQAADALQTMVLQAATPVLVCCALGYGRSVAVVLTWLVRYGHCPTLSQAQALLREARPGMVLPAATANAIYQALEEKP